MFITNKIDFSKPPEGTKKVELSVTYCTSESDIHRANNVLSDDRFRIWQTKEPTPTAVIELQFPTETSISALDICNAGSAFIEVQVGHTYFASPEFEVLLPVTNFMSSSQSINKINRNQIKRFTYDQLNHATRSDKWERIRLLVTQQFLEEPDQIGLACVSVYTNDHSSISNNSSGEISSLKRSKSSISKSNTQKSSISEPQPPTPPSNFNESDDVIMKDKLLDDITPISATVSNPLPGEVIKVDSKMKTDDDTDVEDNSNTKYVNNNNNKKEKEQVDSDDTESDNEGMGYLAEVPKEIPTFSKLLNGVVLVIGGITNPEKGEIRDKALEMGAEYRPGWCREATHLITPFEGTPKYQEAKRGNGSIVRSKWIYDCYKQKLRLPIKQYQFEEMPKTPITPDKKKPQVISTTKKFKKKAIPDYDDSDDDSHIPNEYDYSDNFLVKDDDASGEEEEDDDDEYEKKHNKDEDYGGVKQERENINDLFKDGVDYLKRTFNYQNTNYLSKKEHDKEHPKKKLKLNNSEQKQHYKAKDTEMTDKGMENNNEDDEKIVITNKNYKTRENKSEKPASNSQQLEKNKISPTSTLASQTLSQTTTTSSQSKPNTPNTPPNTQSSQLPYLDEMNTQVMSPAQITNEISRLIQNEKLKHSNDSTTNTVESLIPDIKLSTDTTTSIKNDIKKDSKSPTKPTLKPTMSSLIGKEYIIDPLATFFDCCEFYISVKDETSRKSLTRYIIAYKGSVTNKPQPSTKFIITDKPSWDKLFDITLSKFPNILFVPPSFIEQSHEYQTLLPVEPFLIEKKKK